MAATQSQFSRLPKKQLAFIAEKLVDEDFPIGNPYGDFDNAFNILESVSKYFNITSSQEDVEFFAKLLEVNDDLIADLFANNKEQMKNRELFEQLTIPVAKSYNLDYTIHGTCNYTEYLIQEFDAYDENWVRDSADQQRNDGNWDIYDGQETESTDYNEHQVDDFHYGNVYSVEETQTESILDRLVIENTSDVVKSLDKKTLLKLKSLIESRLRVL
jgi:hypothetical protein